MWRVDKIRLLFAGLVCFVALLFGAHIAFDVLPKSSSPGLIGLGLGVGLIVLAIVIFVIFNLGRRKVPPGPTLAELEAAELVVTADFRAKRAFEVEEYEDEGRSMFIELVDGSVLFLTGQYLYDYGLPDSEIADDSSGAFPTTDFTIRRHRTEGYVLDIISRGKQIEPDFIAKPFGPEIYDQDGVPEDAALIRDRTYDAIKAEHAARK